MHITLFLVTITLSLLLNVRATCPNRCSGRGVCNEYSKCECNKGFMGGDCSLKLCPTGAAWSDFAYRTDLAHAPAECSNRGICERMSGTCVCMTGFGGSACERLECPGECNNHGTCYTMHTYATQKTNELSQQYLYDTEFGSYGVWDADKLKGCVCDQYYQGYDCSQYVCPRGDDPLTKNQVNEVQIVRCIATAGKFTLWYKGFPSGNIPFDATAATVTKALQQIPFLKSINVKYSVPNMRACQVQPNAIIITFTSQFGPQPPLVAKMDATMLQVGTITIAADGQRSITDSNGASFQSIKGTKENAFCSNRGRCSTSDGMCICYNTNGDGYDSSNGYGLAGTRGDCGFISTGVTVSSCPGQVACSGHGLCDTSTYKCSCLAGWEGGDCSDRTCPTGQDWFSYPTADNTAHVQYSTCSNMGICDPVSGTCACREGFFGQACDKMLCGGGYATPCSFHGQCMSMKQLATWTKINGENTDFTYGSDPNEPRTWDADRIHGCMCDPGYEGYDCSLKSCPTGDDPFTWNQHNEVQLLTCTASSGTFTLTFREQTTAPIPFDANANQIRDALLKLPSMVAGGVVWSKSDRAQFLFSSFAETGATKNQLSYPIRVYFKQDNDMPADVMNIIKPALPELEGDPRKQWWPYWSNSTGTYVLPSRNVTTKFCNQLNNQVAVVIFDGIHGNVPGLIPSTTNLVNKVGIVTGKGVINVFEDGATRLGLKSIRGDTEDITCNGRGLCNHEFGTCQCFAGWSSSDGTSNNRPGYIGDCGFQPGSLSHGNSFQEGAGAGLINPNINKIQSA